MSNRGSLGLKGRVKSRNINLVDFNISINKVIEKYDVTSKELLNNKSLRKFKQGMFVYYQEAQIKSFYTPKEIAPKDITE